MKSALGARGEKGGSARVWAGWMPYWWKGTFACEMKKQTKKKYQAITQALAESLTVMPIKLDYRLTCFPVNCLSCLFMI